MVAANDAPLGTAFTVSVDVRHGLTTGISAEQRTNTVRALANGNMGAADFVRPGHVFPLIAKDGGVLMRSGHTEAAVDLCQPRRPAAGRRHLRARQRRRHRDARAADRRLRREARPEAHLGRRPHRLSPGAREARRARRRPSRSRPRSATLTGYAYVDALRHACSTSPSSTASIGDGRDVLTRLHRANVVADMFGGGKSRSRRR